MKEAGGHVESIADENKANFDEFYSLLIVVPEEVNSYETVNVLNYFGFPFNLEEDNIMHKNGIVRYEMGFTTDDEYPILTVQSSKEEVPNMDVSSSE